MSERVAEALALWGLQDADWCFVAGRENLVYRVRGDRGDFALRLRRPGLRSRAELRSELDWLAALDRAGLSVPRPEPSRAGALLETLGGQHVDVVGWLPGRPLGQTGTALDLEDPRGAFRALGREMARLHMASDAFRPPEGFVRAHWDRDGLLGETPLWGRFWDNPTLDAGTRDLLSAFRARARPALDRAEDYGLIHADLVRENVLVDGDGIRLIDFDDGGYGYRLFDLATALIKNRAEPDYDGLKAALLEGYRALRPLDTAQLDLFLALRAVTYVGWIVPRMGEVGACARNMRLISDARALCGAWLS